ncbi:hypothetical protein HPB52_016432 [Rhipicephalus sanguineus]|uniref:Uncharacterized protein n=1 Tax=Rhipicephalus sanguineus TaxID=34632 RepID=A0A9D4T2A5_RHISA|nr:hypothetical protein HPB52_016432 [Rhipicephalus sanguineus]
MEIATLFHEKSGSMWPQSLLPRIPGAKDERRKEEGRLEVEDTRAEKLESLPRAEETSDSELEFGETRDEKREITPEAEDTTDSELGLEETGDEKREITPEAEDTTVAERKAMNPKGLIIIAIMRTNEEERLGTSH